MRGAKRGRAAVRRCRRAPECAADPVRLVARWCCALVAVALVACARPGAPRDDAVPAESVSTASTSAQAALPGYDEAAAPARDMTAELLHSELLAFSERYLEGLGEAADWGADHAPDARARAAFRQLKVVYVSAAVTTVTAPDPLRVLRDLLVMLRLQVLVWEDGGFDSWVQPEARTRMLAALRQLDGQLVQLAARVFPTAAIDLVHELTHQWHTGHPARRYVAFTRFADLGDSPLRRRFEAHLAAGGLLAPVAEASAELAAVRRTAERGLFLANHLPMLLEWQAEALLFDTLKQPEVQGVLHDLDRFASSAEDATALLATLPARAAAERTLALEGIAAAVAQEREAFLSQLATTVAAERAALLRDARSVSGELLPLAETLARVTESSREALAMAAQMRGSQGGDEFSLVEARALVESATRMSSETLQLVTALDTLLGTTVSDARFAALDAILARHEWRLFGYAVALVVLTAVVVCLGVLLVARRRRPAPDGVP